MSNMRPHRPSDALAMHMERRELSPAYQTLKGTGWLGARDPWGPELGQVGTLLSELADRSVALASNCLCPGRWMSPLLLRRRPQLWLGSNPPAVPATDKMRFWIPRVFQMGTVGVATTWVRLILACSKADGLTTARLMGLPSKAGRQDRLRKLWPSLPTRFSDQGGSKHLMCLKSIPRERYDNC